MTFAKWYEEVEGKSHQNLSLQEKNALEHKFFAHLWNASQAEEQDLPSQDNHISAGFPPVAAVG